MRSALLLIAVIIAASCIAFPAAAEVYYSASTPQIITKGDTFTVSGTGFANGTIALWIIGRNYFEVRSVAPDRHGNFSILFKETETMKFSNGQYAVVLQDPGKSRSLEIEPGKDSGGNLTVMNRGKIIIRLGTKENLKGNVQKEAEALGASSLLQGVDDTFLIRYFSVEDPAIHFDEIIPASDARLPDKISGAKIVISGTTNLGTDDIIHAVIQNADSGGPVTIKDLGVIPGSSMNEWKYILEEPGLEAGNYRITLSCDKTNTTGTDTAHFSVRNEAGTAPSGRPPGPLPTGEIPLPAGLDTLLILGILFVGAVIIYTVTKN